MTYSDPQKFDLDEDLQRDIYRILQDRLNDAVEGASERDEDEADFEALFDGAEMAGMPVPYPGACRLVSTIIPENTTTLLANLATFVRQSTLVHAEARRSDDKEAVEKKETWVHDRWKLNNFADHLYLFAQNALKSRAAVFYSGYTTRKRRRHVTKYAEWDERRNRFVHWNEQTGLPDDLMDAELRDETKRYVALPATENEEESGSEYRVVEYRDFYLYPPTARSIEAATCVFERMMFTEDDLLQGVEDYGYDEDAVMQAIERGPTHRSDGSAFAVNDAAGSAERESDARQGLRNELSVVGDGFYECFLGFGRLPKMWENGEARLPEKLFHEEAKFLICFQHNLTLLLAPCEYPQKPYRMRSLLPKNNSAAGTGLVERLEPHHQEATHIIRQVMNATDLEISPEFKMTSEAAARNPDKTSRPNKIWNVDNATDIEPLRKSVTSPVGFEPLSYIDSKAQALSASQGYGQIQVKVRKEAEVQNAVQAAGNKFDLYLYNIFGSFISEEAAWEVEKALIFEPDLYTELPTEEGGLTISSDDLRTPCTWVTAQMDNDTSPQAKEAKNAAILNIQLGYFKAAKQFPEHAEELWYSARQALIDEGVRAPDKILGTKPTNIDPMAMMAQQSAMMGGMGAPNALPAGDGAAAPPMALAAGNGNGVY